LFANSLAADTMAC